MEILELKGKIIKMKNSLYNICMQGIVHRENKFK